jgi:hypothetical protein
MTFLTIKQLVRLYRHIVEILGVKFRFYPYIRFDYADKYGTPYIKIDQNGYHWFVNINNYFIELRYTNDTSKILYWMASYISFTAASEIIDKQNNSLLSRLFKRKKSQDTDEDKCQAIRKKQLELIKKIDLNYEQICKQDFIRYDNRQNKDLVIG